CHEHRTIPYPDRLRPLDAHGGMRSAFLDDLAETLHGVGAPVVEGGDVLVNGFMPVHLSVRPPAYADNVAPRRRTSGGAGTRGGGGEAAPDIAPELEAIPEPGRHRLGERFVAVPSVPLRLIERRVRAPHEILRQVRSGRAHDDPDARRES